MKIWKFIKSNIYAKNILLFFLAVFILILCVKWYLDIYTHHGQAVIVPDVKGINVHEAAPFFENNSLRFEVVDSVYNKNVKSGAIVETIPVAGTKVKKNRNIYITINAFSSQMGIVPEIKDQSQRQAVAKLNAIGFKDVRIKYILAAYKDLVHGLECNGKEIKPGERLPLDSKLTLLVSDGAESVNDEYIDTDDSIYSENEVIVDESFLF